MKVESKVKIKDVLLHLCEKGEISKINRVKKLSLV
jgi:hypothetical protein